MFKIIVRCGVEETTRYRKPRDLGCSVPSAARMLLQGPRLPISRVTTHLTILECSNGNQRRIKFQTSKQTKWLAYRPTSSRRDVNREPYRPKHGIRQRPHMAKETTRVQVSTASLLPFQCATNARPFKVRVGCQGGSFQGSIISQSDSMP